MSRISQVTPATVPELAPLLEQAEQVMGYLPNDVLSLGHWPELLSSLSGLIQTVLQGGEVDPTLKRLIESSVAGLRGVTTAPRIPVMAPTDWALRRLK